MQIVFLKDVFEASFQDRFDLFPCFGDFEGKVRACASAPSRALTALGLEPQWDINNDTRVGGKGIAIIALH